MSPKKNILVGVVAATVMNVASAAGSIAIEKHNQSLVMTELLDGVTVVMSNPECSIKTKIEAQN